MAMVRTRVAHGSTTPMRLIYSTRSPDTLLYRDELRRLSGQDPALRVDLVYTRGAPEGWGGPVGRLDASKLATLGWPPADRPACFVCGPTGFVEATAATGRCANCGRVGPIAETRLFDHAPGLVARCPTCDQVILRMVRGPGRAWLDLRGLTYLQVAVPDEA